ncbi:cholesterol 24-hydroxylase-like [Rhinatrema bivittatum]|uniref:cholesterol 24-hydroxylase-like n=1 Tax=Rhinatrema bivittatum TaxID=194408 RepID=UPI00112C9869|nr:cholesterol 24-hydroxylase-like [Rhinatrema bivittatum]
MSGWLLTLLFLAALLCLLLLLSYAAYVKYVHLKFDHIPGPPRDSFFLGHAPTLSKALESYRNIHDTVLQWAEEYGPIFRINIFHRVAIYAISPEAIKEYLMSPQCPKDPYTYNLFFYLFGKRFLGKGLITDSDNEHWYKQRRIMNPAFSKTYLGKVMGLFNEKAEQMMEKLEEKADGVQEVGFHAMINCVTLDVIAKVAFGMELNLLDGSQTPFPHAIAMVLKGMIHYIQKPYMQYMPQHHKFVREVQKCTDLLRKTGKECIQKRKQAIQNGEDVPQDILTKILECAEQEGDYDDDLMLDNFITFFIAGQETTANQLSFTVMELTRQPEIMAKLRAEVDEVVGLKRDISFDDLGKLQYVTQVLKESLRMYPPAPGTTRYLAEDAVIEGVRVPGGVPLNFSTYVMGRMDKFFKDPYTFDPERFNPMAPKPDHCYFPFALGPRSCLGQVFSQMEAKVVLAKLLQRFEFSLVSGQSYEIMDMGTLRPRDGVVCTVKPRAGAAREE